MLKFFRTKGVTKFILWVILILILPAFLLWGTEALTRSRKGPSFVGLIDSKKVSFNALYESTMAVRCQIILNYGNQPDMVRKLIEDRPAMAKLGWERLIMLDAVKKGKIGIPDGEVANYIRSHPFFARNGRFDEKLYGYLLQYNVGLTPRAFEEFIRENLSIIRFQEGMIKDIAGTDEEAKAKRTKTLDDWFAKLSANAKLNIDLNNIEK